PKLDILEDRTVLSTLTVTSPLDDGSGGTLRAVIAAASPGDTITFARQLKGDTITLTRGELAVGKNLDIEGPGANGLAISGNHASRVFHITGGATVTIAGLTIRNGLVSSPGGAGVLNDSSVLNLSRDVLSDNEALGADPSEECNGGAINNLSATSAAIL